MCTYDEVSLMRERENMLPCSEILLLLPTDTAYSQSLAKVFSWVGEIKNNDTGMWKSVGGVDIKGRCITIFVYEPLNVKKETLPFEEDINKRPHCRTQQRLGDVLRSEGEALKPWQCRCLQKLETTYAKCSA